MNIFAACLWDQCPFLRYLGLISRTNYTSCQKKLGPVVASEAISWAALLRGLKVCAKIIELDFRFRHNFPNFYPIFVIFAVF